MFCFLTSKSVVTGLDNRFTFCTCIKFGQNITKQKYFILYNVIYPHFYIENGIMPPIDFE